MRRRFTYQNVLEEQLSRVAWVMNETSVLIARQTHDLLGQADRPQSFADASKEVLRAHGHVAGLSACRQPPPLVTCCHRAVLAPGGRGGTPTSPLAYHNPL